ncbi:MAG: ubiquinol-cytochrome C chaperone family protein [Rhodospirillaceae bacterium]|nr:ubiquinol-cytochrome C chaperone family protein [Rhodospirillaceae bacterium]OUT79953.1 MAG: hypothetical protein CBB83_03860 [Rhodospirillaceae bacterium TMED23]|tara:strand:- start:4896 stop:5432 length:537 start_codon:yes stop_codon:yes gene_type:complete
MGLLSFFKKPKYDKKVLALYNTIVRVSRTPILYSKYGVADTLIGRFDLIVLHCFVVIRRLNQHGDEGVLKSQELFDVMFIDIDRSLREIGVGDAGLGKKVKSLATAFYGRLGSYGEAIDSKDSKTLIESLKRNLFSETNPSDYQLSLAANYLRNRVIESEKWSFADIDNLNIFQTRIE